MEQNYISKKILREFGIALGILFPLILAIFIPLIYGHNFIKWPFLVGFIFLSLGLLSPNLLLYPYKIWMRLGNLLGFINGYLILGIIYIIVLIPISLMMKLFKYNPLKNKWDNKKSYKISCIQKNIDLTKIF